MLAFCDPQEIHDASNSMWCARGSCLYSCAGSDIPNKFDIRSMSILVYNTWSPATTRILISGLQITQRSILCVNFGLQPATNKQVQVQGFLDCKYADQNIYIEKTGTRITQRIASQAYSNQGNTINESNFPVHWNSTSRRNLHWRSLHTTSNHSGRANNQWQSIQRQIERGKGQLAGGRRRFAVGQCPTPWRCGRPPASWLLGGGAVGVRGRPPWPCDEGCGAAGGGGGRRRWTRWRAAALWEGRGSPRAAAPEGDGTRALWMVRLAQTERTVGFQREGAFCKTRRPGWGRGGRQNAKYPYLCPVPSSEDPMTSVGVSKVCIRGLVFYGWTF